MSRFKDIDWSTILVERNPTFPENWRKDVDLTKKDELQRQLNEKRRKEIQDEQAKVRKQYIIYGLIAVAGYFAYKKFKK